MSERMRTGGAGWLGIVGRLVDLVFSLLSWLVLQLRARIGAAPELQIVAFDGYLTAERCTVRGRVVEDRGEQGDVDPVGRVLAKLRRVEIPRSRVRISLDGRSWETTSDEQGYFRFDITPPAGAAAGGGWRDVTLDLVEAPVPGRVHTTCVVLRVPATATLGVLSDLDDTVIRAHSGNPLEMVGRTLLQTGGERSVVPGVPALYRTLVAGRSASDGNPVFYHSNQPWNTYEHLHEALDQNDVPRGPMFLRQHNAQSLLGTSDTEHKTAAVNEVLEAFPTLPFLLLGDGAGDDAEAYVEVARRHAGRIRTVYLWRNGDEERAERVEELAERIRALAVEVVLVERAAEIERHARERGWIADDAQRRAS